MRFKKNKPIYLQIKNMIIKNIIEKNWEEDEKIPSVRKLSKEIGVNPNTVMKSIKELQREDIMQNIRGVGNKIKKGSRKRLINRKKMEFYKKELKSFIEKAKMINISKKDLINKIKTNWK